MTTETTITASDALPDGVVSRTVYSDGVITFWDAQGRRHNPDGPAIINPDKFTFWLMTGLDPRVKVEGFFGYRHWYIHGRAHRTDGPACERRYGTSEFWVDGEFLSEERFYQLYPESLRSQPQDNRA